MRLLSIRSTLIRSRVSRCRPVPRSRASNPRAVENENSASSRGYCEMNSRTIVNFHRAMLGVCLGLGFSGISRAAQVRSVTDLPAWVDQAGARTVPASRRTCSVNSFGAVGDGAKISTRGIQQAIDSCAAAGGGTVTFARGRYVTGALFLKINVQRNVKLSGGGVINGRGEKWWDKYQALRGEYTARGLRWAADYDAERVR